MEIQIITCVQMPVIPKYTQEINKDLSSNIYEIIDSIEADLKKLKEMNLYDDDQSIIVRDRIADGIRIASIRMFNEARQFQDASRMLQIAVQTCGTDSLKNDLTTQLNQMNKVMPLKSLTQEEIKKAQEKLKVDLTRKGLTKEEIKEAQEKLGIDLTKQGMGFNCWFCKNLLKGNNPDQYLHQRLHKVISREYRKIQYQWIDVPTPRCKDCKASQESDSYIVGLMALSVLVLFFINPLIAIVYGIILYFVEQYLTASERDSTMTYSISEFINGFTEGKSPWHAKPYKYKNEYPRYKELINQGWTPGQRPSQ